MRFNVTRLLDETPLNELYFSKSAQNSLKRANYETVNDVLQAFSDRSIFTAIQNKETIHEIALTICNPKLSPSYKTSRLSYLDEDDAIQAQLNASLLMLSENAQKVLKRFSITVPEQLGYVLDDYELETIMDLAYDSLSNHGSKLYKKIDYFLTEVYSFIPDHFEMELRGKFASETYQLKVKSVFNEPEFEVFRQYCDDLGILTIDNLAGFSPSSLRKSIGASDALICSIIERCKRIEQGDAAKFSRSSPSSRNSKTAHASKCNATERRNLLALQNTVQTSIYGANELADYIFIDPDCPNYIFDGYPLTFSYCDDVYTCDGWYDFFVKALRFLCKDSPKKFDKILGWRLNDNLPAVLYRKEQEKFLTNPHRISSSVVAETNFRIPDIIEILKSLLIEWNIPLQEFSITCICPIKSFIDYFSLDKYKLEFEHIDIEKFSEDPSFRRTMFNDWLIYTKGIHYFEVHKYMKAISIASEWMLQLSISQSNFFEFNDIQTLIRCRNELLWNDEFQKLDGTLVKYCSNAIELLIKFYRETNVNELPIENNDDEDTDGEPDIDIERANDNMSPRRILFETWLDEKKHLTSHMALKYIAAINIASEWAKDLSISQKNFFDVKDSWRIIKLTDKLLANPIFSRFDTSTNMFYSDAIDLLTDYCMDNE